MIIVECEQGSRRWIETRLGIPTASQFSKIVTPTGKLSASREGYLGELLAEWCLGEERGADQTEWMERGKVLEEDAFNFYAVREDADPQKVGFCFRDKKRLVGCSPDALVGENGLLELKCPIAGKHLTYLFRKECPKEHYAQVQGQLWVTQREYCDFMSYHPGLPPFILRCFPDEKYQEALNEAIPRFCEELEAGREQLGLMGVNCWTDEGESIWE